MEDTDIRINNISIERVYYAKFLGVQIDHQLNWKKHTEYISSKLSKCIGLIIKAKKNLPKAALITLYYTFAYPYFTYCIPVWGNSSAGNSDKLFKLQKKMLRIITESKYRAHTDELFRETKILRFQDIYRYSIFCLCINIITICFLMYLKTC